MTKQQIKAGVASLLVGVLAPMALTVPSVSAATDIEWVGNVSSQYGAFVNWSPQSVPFQDIENAVFTTSSNNQVVEVTAGGPYTPNKLIFSGDNPGTSSKNYTITGNLPITIMAGIDAIMTGAGGDHAVKTDVTLGANATFKTSGVDSLQVGDTGTTLDLGTYNLTLNAGGGTITLAGSIDGSGKLILSGSKSVNMLAKGAVGYTGSVEVTSGVFATTAETEGNILVNGGTLKGNSNLLGTVTMSSGAIAPGNSPGCLGTSNLVFTGGSYDIEINGLTQCTQYDSTTVVGTVNLGNTTALNIQRLSSYAPAVNDTFAIIVNDSTDKVQGEFVGKPNGSTFVVDGYTYQINYDAGVDANDVLLLVKATPTAPDTGIGSALTSPLLALGATLAAFAVVGGLKFADKRRK